LLNRPARWSGADHQRNPFVVGTGAPGLALKNRYSEIFSFFHRWAGLGSGHFRADVRGRMRYCNDLAEDASLCFPTIER